MAVKVGQMRRSTDGPFVQATDRVAIYTAIGTVGLKRREIAAVAREAAVAVEERMRELLTQAVDRAEG